MRFEAQKSEYTAIEPLRHLFRHEAQCQCIKDSILARGFADPYLLLAEGRVAGYGGVWNRYDVGRVMEFYVLPYLRPHASALFETLLAASHATGIEAQTNIPWMLTALFDYATEISEQNILFEDSQNTQLRLPDATFRRIAAEEKPQIFEHHSEPVGDWGIEMEGAIVATGGFLCHYNPPYGDLFMEVEAHWRGRGIGSYLVQELKRVCYEAGKRPAARCNPDNIASRRTLAKAGFSPCGRYLAGKIAPKPASLP